MKNEQFSYLGWKTQKWFVTFCQCFSTLPVLTISLPRWRGRGWLRDRSPGLLWGVSAGRGDHPVRHLSSSVPPRLPWAWAGQGPRGQVELSPLCKYNCAGAHLLLFFIFPSPLHRFYSTTYLRAVWLPEQQKHLLLLVKACFLGGSDE